MNRKSVQIPERNHQVDGLKGLAMLIVMAYHFLFRFAEIYPIGKQAVLPLLDKWGVIGVTVFYVISGYYLARNTLGGYALLENKISRLWPTYAIGITLCYVLTLFLPLPGRSVKATDYLLNLTFINGFCFFSYVDSAHWYITDLIGCINVYAIVNRAKDDKTRAILMTAFVILCLLLQTTVNRGISSSVFTFSYGLTGFGRLSMVLAGEVIYLLNNNNFRIAAYFEVLSIILCLFAFKIKYTAVMIISQVLLYLTVKEYLRLLAIKPLCAVGKASYSVYVFHQNIGFILIYYVSKIIGHSSLLLQTAV